MDKPEIIILVSGKRKSGKDYICEKVKSLLGEEKCSIIRISEPLKKLYSEKHNLDGAELMTDGPYKEKYRLDMINWSDEVRKEAPGYFCRVACEAPSKAVWIVSDIRRKSDIAWFRDTYTNKIKTVRISADVEVRKSRGWKYTEGVDDVESECNLDDFNDWDIQISNNSTKECEFAVEKVISVIRN
ncbi:phosphomevalonate kinase isoform X1 [Leptinotarsa decemlineata]|uniref:phosphomevalonate kinase isoform X1 n=1 Tax=Leptinotarsa decemlineata TaxID=7539 RepID=UPI003D309BBF